MRFNLRGAKIFSAPSGVTMGWIRKHFQGATMPWTSFTTTLNMVRNEDQTTCTTAAKKFCFLFVRFLKGKVCANNFTIKAFENGKLFDTTGYGKVCSCAPALNCLYTDR